MDEFELVHLLFTLHFVYFTSFPEALRPQNSSSAIYEWKHGIKALFFLHVCVVARSAALSVRINMQSAPPPVLIC